MTDSRILAIKALIALLLVGISATAMFVPVSDVEVKAMFVLLTGIAVRDFFGATQEDKRVQNLKDAYDPPPADSHVRED